MNPDQTPRSGAPVPPTPGNHPGWWLAFLALLGAQGWLTLGLFGSDHRTDSLLDARPVLSGRHPLHLYHGCLGARALGARGTLSCYDPAFQAGYPKTPVFDDGSRPAEALLALVGGGFRPEVYKLGLAGLCLLAPCVFALTARAAGMNRFRACLACGLGMLVWWGRPCRDLLEAGDFDLLLGGLCATAQMGLLVRYHRRPGPVSLIGVLLAGFIGWFAHPFLMILVVPVFLLYYLTSGPRHHLLWHVALLVGLAGSVLANGFWLLDWIDYWWIRTPLSLEAPVLSAHTLRAVWEAPVWGEPADRTVCCFLLGAAAVGVCLLHRTGQRPTARLFGLGLLGLLLMALGAVVWSPLGRLGADRLLVPALLFTLPAAAHGLTQVVQPVRRWAGWGGACVVGGGLLVALTLAIPSHRAAWTARVRTGQPLQIGLGADREAVVAALKEHTTTKARILWEDRRGSRGAPHWTALLPLLTERVFVGGLDPEAGIEHTAGGLYDQTLAGRPLDDWSDADLHEYCKRYNIGWVVCWSQKAVDRFTRWADEAEPTTDLHGDGGGRLFTLRRSPSYALSGSAQVHTADANRIVLCDVKPRNGPVVLSFHYLAGLRAAPSRVRLERQPDPAGRDPIPFIRLVLDEPAPVVTITWDKR